MSHGLAIGVPRKGLTPLGFVAGLAVMLLAACTSAPPATGPDKAAIVMAYVDAYNEYDIDALAPMLHPDVEWVEPSEAGPKVVTGNREELLAYLETAFMTETVITTTMSDLEVTADGVRGVETASWWVSEDEQKSLSAPVAYTISDDGLIRRVEYLPTFETPSGGE